MSWTKDTNNRLAIGYWLSIIALCYFVRETWRKSTKLIPLVLELGRENRLQVRYPRLVWFPDPSFLAPPTRKDLGTKLIQDHRLLWPRLWPSLVKVYTICTHFPFVRARSGLRKQPTLQSHFYFISQLLTTSDNCTTGRGIYTH